MKHYALRLSSLMLGLLVCGLGCYLCIEANIGLAPWDAFHTGVSILSGLSIGTACIIFSLIIATFDYFIGQKIGFGTLLNSIFVGLFIDMFTFMELVPPIDNFFHGVICLLAGLTLISIGSIFYIGAGIGCGPRDCLMVALCERFPAVPVGVIRAEIEGFALAIGYLCGAKVGFGTVIAVFGIGAIMQFVFKVAHFDLRAIVHEDFADTIAKIKTENAM